MSSLIALPALDNTMGALFIGVVLSMALWGTCTVQMYYYYNGYRSDIWQLKLLVFVVWALDTVHQGLITHTAYTYLVTHFGDYLFLEEVVKSLIYMVPVSGVICFLVQCFLAMRVWHLSHKNLYLIVPIIGLIIGELIVTMVYSSQALTLTVWSQTPEVSGLSRTINVLGAASDAAIAGTLIFLLHKSRTGFSKSDTMINRLIMFTINTGLLTTLCAIASLVTISALPNTDIYITFFFAVSKLYTNSLLATLNARKSLRGRGANDSEEMSMSLNRMRNHDAQTLPKTSTRALSIKVDTETTKEINGLYSAPKAVPSDNDSETGLHSYRSSEKAI